MIDFLEFYCLYELEEECRKNELEKRKKERKNNEYAIYNGIYIDNPDLIKRLGLKPKKF